MGRLRLDALGSITWVIVRAVVVWERMVTAFLHCFTLHRCIFQDCAFPHFFLSTTSLVIVSSTSHLCRRRPKKLLVSYIGMKVSIRPTLPKYYLQKQYQKVGINGGIASMPLNLIRWRMEEGTLCARPSQQVLFKKT